MKKRLLAVYVASTLAGIGGISSAALTGTNPRRVGVDCALGVLLPPPDPCRHRATPLTFSAVR